MSTKKSGELRAEHPSTPEEWVSELELHAPNARRIVVRYAGVKRSWVHAGTFRIEPAEEGFTEFWQVAEEMDGTDIHLSDACTARAAVKHIWAVLCDAGLVYAADQSLSLIRGQFEVQSGDGSPLNDAGTCNKNLSFADPAKPYTANDETLSKGEASAYGQLRFALTENRRLSTSLQNHQQRDEERSQSRADGERALREQSRALSEQMIAFAQYEKRQIAADLDEMRSEVRLDLMAESAVKMFEKHAEHLGHDLGVYLRTGGGKQADGARVPNMPDDVLLWVLAYFGAEQYAQFSSDCLKAQAILPSAEGYELAWLSVLSVLNESLEGIPVPDLLAAHIRAWANAAVSALGADPHTYSRLVFVEGAGDHQADDDE